jgi:hypothetical protein
VTGSLELPAGRRSSRVRNSPAPRAHSQSPGGRLGSTSSRRITASDCPGTSRNYPCMELAEGPPRIPRLARASRYGHELVGADSAQSKRGSGSSVGETVEHFRRICGSDDSRPSSEDDTGSTSNFLPNSDSGKHGGTAPGRGNTGAESAQVIPLNLRRPSNFQQILLKVSFQWTSGSRLLWVDRFSRIRWS